MFVKVIEAKYYLIVFTQLCDSVFISNADLVYINVIFCREFIVGVVRKDLLYIIWFYIASITFLLLGNLLMVPSVVF